MLFLATSKQDTQDFYKAGKKGGQNFVCSKQGFFKARDLSVCWGYCMLELIAFKLVHCIHQYKNDIFDDDMIKNDIFIS